MSTPGIMRKFKLTAIAAVDSPAQKGARMAIMKRDDGVDDSAFEKLCKRTFTADERKKAEASGAAMPGGRYPIENVSDLENAIHAVGRGKGSHAAIRRHIISRAKALDASDKIPDDWKASKSGDESDDAIPLKEDSEQSKDANSDSATDGSSDDMKGIAKALGLPETATEAEVVAKLGEMTKASALNASVAKMSAKHKGYMDHEDAKMPSGGKEAFANMSPSERDAHMEKNPIKGEDEDEVEKSIKKGDAFRTPEGALITKSKVGADVFSVLKSQNDRIIKQADELAKSEDRRLTAEFAKRAEPLAFIGKADEVGGLLHEIAKFDAKLADKVETILKTANKRIADGELMKEHGSGLRLGSGGDMSKASGVIETKARELLSSEPALFKSATLDKMAKARAEIRKRNPELAKQEAEEAKQRRAA